MTRYLNSSYRNEVEEGFRQAMSKRGWQLTKRGWPDFACWHPERGFIVVEVKPSWKGRPVKLKISQEKLMKELQACGVRCFIFSPSTGLIPLDAHPKPRMKKYKPLSNKRLVPRGCLI